MFQVQNYGFYHDLVLLVNSYHLRATIFSCSNSCVIDLGFILGSNLDSDPHIEYICYKAFKTLCLKTIWEFLVRLII